MTSDRFQELHGDAHQELKDNTADDFADGWDWTETKWTDESKRLQLSCDDVNFTGTVYWHEPDNQWIVVLSKDVRNNAGERIYGILEECGSFDTYQDAREYLVELTEQYP